MGSCTRRRRRRCNIESVKAMTKHGHVTLKSWLVPLHTHAPTQTEGRITGELYFKKNKWIPDSHCSVCTRKSFNNSFVIVVSEIRRSTAPHSLGTPFRRKFQEEKKMFFLNLLRRIFRLESSNSLKFPPFVSHSLIGKTTGPNPGTDLAVKSTNRMVYLNYMQIIRSVLKSVGIF